MNQYIITEEQIANIEEHGWIDAFHTLDQVRSHPYQSERRGEYYPITKEELSFIKNNCAIPETDSCDGCEFACDDEKSCPCSWLGANGLEEQILSRHPYQSERDNVLDELLNWKPGYKQYRGNWIVKVDDLYTKIEELRQAGKP